ncbi:MAG TPA: hypothetical protein VF764_09010 [Steroidobacteraceae bacterium]
MSKSNNGRGKRAPKMSPEERARLERLSGKLQKYEAAVKRTKTRLVRAFGAWQRAEVQLARTIKAIERPPTGEPAEPLPFNDSLEHL